MKSLFIMIVFGGLSMLFQYLSLQESASEAAKREKEAAREALGMKVMQKNWNAERTTGQNLDVKRSLESGYIVYKPVNKNPDGRIAFRVVTRDLYGKTRIMVAVDSSKQTILGTGIIEDASSPGYGNSRLTSRSWLRKLQDQPLFPPGNGQIAYKRRSKSLDGVTGASVSLKAASRFNKLIGSSLAGFVGGGTELVPLELDLSVDAVTRATPGYPGKQVKPPHLRAEIRRPTFLTPPGTRLLSAGKPVSSSMEYEPIIGELEQITDGVKTCMEFDYVELDAGPQWIQIDLEEEFTIYLVVIWHYYKNPVIYQDVIVKLSNDESFKRGVVTIYNNDHDNSSNEGQGSDSAYYARWWGEFADARGPAFRGTRARYVRIYTNGGTGMEDTRFVEAEVYGK